MGRRHGAVVGAIALLALVGCATSPDKKPLPSPPPPSPAPLPPAPTPAPPQPQGPMATPGLSARERVLKILRLLGDGDRVTAGAEANELVREDPNNALAQILLSQITKDPHELFGDKHFSYKILPGESLSVLAERFLGDRFLFYALARYNGIEAPNKAEVGQTIQIPGDPPKPTATRRRPPVSDADAVDARLGPKPPPAPPAPAPAAHKRDPARAQALRGRALVLLNSGASSRAVALLKEALDADPDNAAVKRDLERAQRINGAPPR